MRRVAQPVPEGAGTGELGVIPKNCWTYALRRRVKSGGSLRFEKVYGWVPRMIWVSPCGKYEEYYVAKARRPWESLSTMQKVFPLHVLHFDGKVIKRKVK